MKSWLWLVLGVAACAISWTYMHRVLLPWEHYVNVDHGRLKAQMGDLYPRWVGTRELFLNGRNPYGPEVSHEIQIAFYGHPIEQTYDKPMFDIVDEQRFVYPIFVVFLLAPTVHADFSQLEAWAPIVLGAFVAITVLLWLNLLKWHPPPPVLAGVILIVLSTPQIAQGLRLRQFGFFVVFLLALATWCIARNQLAMAGALLALATIKPQMVVLCLVWFLIWSVGDWKRRWQVAAGFGGFLILLILGGEFLLRGWPRDFLEGLDAYRKYFPTTSPVRLVLGDWLGGGISILGTIALIGYAWGRRAVKQDSQEFLDVMNLFLLASTLFLPLLTPYNQALLVLPVLMLIRDWTRLSKLAKAALIAVFVWPQIIAVILLLHRPNLQSMNRTPLLPSAFVILIPFLVGWLMFARQSRAGEVSTS